MKKLYFAIVACALTAAFVMSVYATTTTSENDAKVAESQDLVTLYEKHNNNNPVQVTKGQIDSYLSTGNYGTSPMTKMYAADGRIMFIASSEVDVYLKLSWSLYPPVTIYSRTGSLVVLQEQVQDYLDTGHWFRTEAEIPRIVVSYDAFTPTNFTGAELEACLSKGLKGYGNAFAQMERDYGVNAVFAISVAELESGYGTSSAFRNKNNPFGLGPGNRYASVNAAISTFGALMNKNWYKGKTIEGIAVVYCNYSWAGKVRTLMSANYTSLGY